jgi:hypothetical protein
MAASANHGAPTLPVSAKGRRELANNYRKMLRPRDKKGGFFQTPCHYFPLFPARRYLLSPIGKGGAQDGDTS